MELIKSFSEWGLVAVILIMIALWVYYSFINKKNPDLRIANNLRRHVKGVSLL